MTDTAGSQGSTSAVRLYTLTYVSSAKHQFSEFDLLELLENARRSNAKLGITGLLLHKGNAFFQILEGMQSQVLHVFDLICADERHENIDILAQEDTRVRQFPDWRMGFVDLDTVDPRLLPGYSDFLEKNQSPRGLFTQMSRSQRLAHIFKSTV